GRLEVSVHDPPGMRVLESRAASLDDVGRLRVRTRAVAHPRLERLTCDELHAHEPQVAFAGELKHPCDVGMSQPSHRVELSIQAGRRPLPDPSWAVQKLYGHEVAVRARGCHRA